MTGSACFGEGLGGSRVDDSSNHGSDALCEAGTGEDSTASSASNVGDGKIFAALSSVVPSGGGGIRNIFTCSGTATNGMPGGAESRDQGHGVPRFWLP